MGLKIFFPIKFSTIIYYKSKLLSRNKPPQLFIFPSFTGFRSFSSKKFRSLGRSNIFLMQNDQKMVGRSNIFLMQNDQKIQIPKFA
jgi:hypothetical protein